MLAAKDFGIGRFILDVIGKLIGKTLGKELELWAVIGLGVVFFGGLLVLHIFLARRERKAKPEIVDARAKK